MKIERFLIALSLFAAGGAAAQDPPATDVFLVALERAGGEAKLGAPVNVTDRAGYDNQPCYLPGGRRLLYTAMDDEGRTDIWIYDLETKTRSRFTETPESEYSPTPIPGEDAISVVRVEADERQRLWRFPRAGGAPDLLLPNVEPVGYHAWADDESLALFVLGDPITLQAARRGAGEGKVLAENVGRSLHRVPQSSAVSFVHKQSDDRWVIRQIDLATGEAKDVIATLPGREDFAWSPSGELWMGDGGALYVARPGSRQGFRQVADFAALGIQEITRIAVRPDGKQLAFAALPPE